MADLRPIEEIYPHEVTFKHKGEKFKVCLAVVKWLESEGIMNIVDFHLEMNFDDEAGKSAVLFKSKKPAKLFKACKKQVRDAALQS